MRTLPAYALHRRNEKSPLISQKACFLTGEEETAQEMQLFVFIMNKKFKIFNTNDDTNRLRVCA